MPKIQRQYAEEIPSVSEIITQTSHGFTIGDVIRYNGSSYVKAQADTESNAEVIGVVESVSGNMFVVVYSGRISGLSDKTAGTTYFLSSSTAGAMTNIAPTISRTVLLATSSTSGIVINTRGSSSSGFQGATGPQGNTGFQGVSGPQGIASAFQDGPVFVAYGTGYVEQIDEDYGSYIFVDFESTDLSVSNSGVSRLSNSTFSLDAGKYLIHYIVEHEGDSGGATARVYNSVDGSLLTSLCSNNAPGRLDWSCIINVSSTATVGIQIAHNNFVNFTAFGKYLFISRIGGTKGDRGFQGYTGVQGFTGNQGNIGFQGNTGNNGVQGVSGPQGLTGSIGFQGPSGVQGYMGATGDTGATGPTGLQGLTGAGVQGATGFQGSTGPQGLTGATGSIGVQGFTGIQGPMGAQGAAFDIVSDPFFLALS